MARLGVISRLSSPPFLNLHEPTPLLVGIDWGNETHQVCVLSDDGEHVEQKSFAHKAESLSQLITWLLKLTDAPKSVYVAIERPHGAVVELLLQHEFAVYSINLKQLDRFRDRHTVAVRKTIAVTPSSWPAR